MHKWQYLLFSLIFSLSGCLFASVVHAAITVENPQVRLLPPGVPNSSAYFVLKNDGDKMKELIGAESPLVNKVEIHNHVMADGVMRMEKQDKLVVKADSSIVFQPGGYHLMLFGIKSPFKENQSVPITLQFADGEQVKIDAVVSAEIVQMQQHHHHHNH